MSTAFKVGVFALATVIAVFIVWAVLGNYSLRHNSYQIGIHFTNVAGLQVGSSVQLAGVDIGIVDDIKLLSDQTALVICTVNGDNVIYRESVFTVATTLTGSSTLTIFPPTNLASAHPLPRHILPESEQPVGTVPPTIADLVSEGEKRMRDLDKTLAIVNAELPGIVNRFNGVAEHTDLLIVHADKNFTNLGAELNNTIASVDTVVNNMNQLVAVNGRNISDMTTTMRALVVNNSGRLNSLIASLASSSENLDKTMASVESLATNPTVKNNLVETTNNLRESSEKLKAIANDIESITGDPKTQAQLKDTVANLDDAIAKANAILGNYSTAQGAPQTQPSGGTVQPGSSASPSPGTHAGAPATTAFHTGSGSKPSFDLVEARARIYWNQTPAGALSDLDITLLPRFKNFVTFGVDNMGSTTTYDFLLGQHGSPNLTYSFGVLRSQLGLQTNWHGLGPFGAWLNVYNTKQPQLDLYGDLRLAKRLQLFYGEKSLMGPAANRTPQYGIQFGY